MSLPLRNKLIIIIIDLHFTGSNDDLDDLYEIIDFAGTRYTDGVLLFICLTLSFAH